MLHPEGKTLICSITHFMSSILGTHNLLLVVGIVFTFNITCRIAATSGSHGGDGSPGPSDNKRMKTEAHSKIFKVEITFAAKVRMNNSSQDALRVLDIILRQHSAKQYVLKFM